MILTQKQKSGFLSGFIFHLNPILETKTTNPKMALKQNFFPEQKEK